MGFQYKMSKLAYDAIKYPMYWDAKEKTMKRSKKGLTNKEVLEYVNKSFGLLQPVVEIVLI